MKWLLIFGIVAMVVCMASLALAADHGFLFGTIYTDRGDELTGRIRWDKNEGFWDDVIDATKYDDERYESRQKRRSRIKIFGLNITTNDMDWDWTSSSAQLRFGNVKEIEPRSRGRATVELKNGERVRFEDSGSDLGSGIRGIEIDVDGEGITKLDWSDIDRVVFFPEPDGYTPTDRTVERLYGHLTTEDGQEFTGFIMWDADEIYSSDILDGDEHGRDREIRFDAIESIEKISSRGCEVKLKSGREMELRGSNDVDSGNRGIYVIMPNIGQVKVEWDEFEKLAFMTPPSGLQPTYDQFDGGKRLRGTVTDEKGDHFTGDITWDNDERWSWEFLNGNDGDAEYDIEFSKIKKIERRSSRSSKVTLRDGTVVELRGSNDVDDDNKGIFVETTDGDLVELDWDEFEVLEFE